MPMLGITVAMIDAQPEVAAIQIGAVMLWPDDEKVRSQAIEAGLADSVRRAARSWQGNLTMSADILEWMLGAPRPQDFDVRNRYRNGVAAGNILLRAVGANQINLSTGLTKIKADIEQRLGLARSNRDRQQRPVSAHTEKIWQSFKPVAHLWAAHGFYRHHNAVPCSSNDIEQFLACAEECRLLGEATKPRGSPSGPVLQAGVAWIVPHEITLPMGHLRFRRNTR